MTSPRYPLPTDLAALVTFDGRVYPNEAKPWERLGSAGQGPHPLGTALEQWFSFATGRHTWVSVRGATIRGLISARRRAKRSVWEVDCLILADDDQSVVISLLQRMCVGVMRLGAERVFLRLSAQSPLLSAVRQAGFFVYRRETLYRRESLEAPGAPSLPLRPRTKADAFGIYHLYVSLTPASVRAVEGPTFQEWQAAQEPWGRRAQDLVLEEDNEIVGWLRLQRGQEGRFSILSRPDGRREEALVRDAASRLGSSRSLLCLVPSHAGSLARQLRRLGFLPAGEYVGLAKRMVEPVRERALDTVGTVASVSS